MALHAAADHGAVEHVQGREERGRAVALVVVRHGAGPAGLHRQARLGAVERLDLALLVDRQHDGMGRRVDVEADDVAQLRHELGITRELEAAQAMGCEPMRLPDALHRRDADLDRLGHRGGGPVRGLVGRLGRGERHDPVDHLLPERRHTGGPRLVAQEALDTDPGEALLPAPDAGLRCAGPAHDLNRADALGREQYDLGPPDVLLRRVAIRDNRIEAAAFRGRKRDRDPRAHAPDSHAPEPAGIPVRTHLSDLIH